MTTPPSRVRAYLSAARHLPSILQQSTHVARDHQLLTEQVRRDEDALRELTQRVGHLEDRVASAVAALDRMHQTLVDADPRMAYDVVTAVRDDVRSLLIEVTEQSNLAASRRARPAPATDPVTSPVTDS